ncbi:hypothetical protein VTL71DRAFT_7629 [Oculimacula yallundae]|uniref:Uncharacterized protein n=1 Tax=Oculimacula yallundae TaxID=86028 RepID=A0ABR4BVU9_9HELO
MPSKTDIQELDAFSNGFLVSVRSDYH